MSISYQVTLEDCELSEENVWANIKNVDKLNQLDLMCLIMESYYKFHNNTKTPKDLELELRARNFNFGLIACDKDNDPDVKREFINGNIHFIKSQYIFGKEKIDLKNDLEDKHIAKYYVIVSCRHS